MTPAERNRAEFPEFAAIVDEIRARGGTANILWAANSTGYQVGPVPAGWESGPQERQRTPAPWRSSAASGCCGEPSQAHLWSRSGAARS